MVYFSCSILPFHAPELHWTHICYTPTCCPPGPRGGTLSRGIELGWVGILSPGRGTGLKPILLDHYLIALTSHYYKNIVSLLQFTVFSRCQLALQKTVVILFLKLIGTKHNFSTYFSNSGEMNHRSHAMTCDSYAVNMPVAVYPVCTCHSVWDKQRTDFFFFPV